MKKILSFLLLLLLFSQISSNNNYKKDYINNIYDYNKSIYCTIVLNYEPIKQTDDYKYYDNKIFLDKLRNQNKEYYSSRNIEFINQYNIDIYDYSYSNYSPFICIKFNNYDSFLNSKNEIDKLLNNDLVKRIYLENYEYKYNDEEVNDDITTITMDEVKEMVGIVDDNNTGSGVSIGIIENDKPYNIPQLSNSNIIINNCIDYGIHSTAISSILVGEDGILPDATLYIRGNSGSLDNDTNYLLDSLVTIISLSFGNVNPSGVYTANDEMLDYIANENNVLIIKSAGNEGLNSSFITNPGIGFNVLTVGSVNKNKQLSSFSSSTLCNYLDNNGVVKPNILAPGENIVINIGNISTLISGTSYSAPIVAGVIGKIIQERYYYAFYYDVFYSALLNGANQLNCTYSLYSSGFGAGIINYANTKNILNNSQFIRLNMDDASNQNVVVQSISITVAAQSKCDIFAFHSFNQVKYNGYSNVIDRITKYKFDLYDDNGLIDSYSNNSNINYISIRNDTNTSKSYYLSVNIYGSKIENGTEFIALSYKHEHIHSYSSAYLYINNSKHRAYCICERFIEDVHTVHVVTSISGYCIYCGRIIDLRNNITRFE